MRWLKTMPTEHDLCAAFWSWVTARRKQDWYYRHVKRIVNEQKCSYATAAYFRAEGREKGILDYAIFLPAGRYCGAWIEFKELGGKLTDEQLDFAGLMSNAGYLIDVVRSVEDAVKFCEFYFSLRKGAQTRDAA